MIWLVCNIFCYVMFCFVFCVCIVLFLVFVCSILFCFVFCLFVCLFFLLFLRWVNMWRYIPFAYFSTTNKDMSKQRTLHHLWTMSIQKLDTMIQYVCLSPKQAWRGLWNPVKLNRLFCYERLRSIMRLIQPQTILWDCQHMDVYITKNSEYKLFGIRHLIPHCYALLSGCDSWRCHQMETFSALLALCEGNPPVTCGFPDKASETEVRCFLWSAPGQTVEQIMYKMSGKFVHAEFMKHS